MAVFKNTKQVRELLDTEQTPSAAEDGEIWLKAL